MTCPHCGAECEYLPPDVEGDASEPGGRLLNELPAMWACTGCDFAVKAEPEDDDE